MLTRQPDFTQLSGSVTVGGNVVDHGGNGGVARLYVNAPFAANTMALQLSAFDRYSPGFINDVNGRKDVNDSHTSGGRLVYTWAFSDDWRVAISALTHRVTSNDSNTEDVDCKDAASALLESHAECADCTAVKIRARSVQPDPARQSRIL